jgi:hypothetical protein
MITMTGKYKTRYGAPARILCVDRLHHSSPVVALIEGHVTIHTATGLCSSHGSGSAFDLVETIERVPVDTPMDAPIWVRASMDSPWYKRHFAGINNSTYTTAWRDGKTSHTSDGATDAWLRSTLVNPEDTK